jgi:hypothetical protein
MEQSVHTVLVNSLEPPLVKDPVAQTLQLAPATGVRYLLAAPQVAYIVACRNA